MTYKDLIKKLQTEMNRFGETLAVDGVAPKYWKPLIINGVNVHPIFKVHASYTHLHPYDFLMHFRGEKEILGSKHNPLIAHFHEHAGNLGEHSDKNDYSDEVPHCSSALNWAADGCGCYKSNNALASSWRSYVGQEIKKGQKVPRGAIIETGSHVTLCNKEFVWDGSGSYEGFGSNQADSIKVSVFPESGIKSVHLWKPLPGTRLAPIGTPAIPAEGSMGESTR